MTTPATSRYKFGPVYSHNIESLQCDDCLGRLEIARSVARQVLLPHPDDLPKVLGIYGSWGSGKSFLLAQVISLLLEANHSDEARRALLRDVGQSYAAEAMQRRCIVVPFEAWRYELEGDLAPGLIDAIARADTKFSLDGWHEGAPKRANPQFKRQNEIGKVAKALTETLLEMVETIHSAKILTNLVRRLSVAREEMRAEAEEERARIDQVRNKMEELVKTIFDSVHPKEPGASYRLVVVIDDLDRCSPENMVRLFEWLKNHLNVGQCVFIMALDHEAAARAIVGRYKTYLGEDHDIAYGYRYLEKLIDLEWELELSPDVESMALREIGFQQGNTPNGNLSLAGFIEARLGQVFPGRDDIRQLMALRSFGTPRTMLKIVNKCRLALDLLTTEAGQAALARVKFGRGDYPFWLVLLIAMYYSLKPYELGEFARETGLLYRVFSGVTRDVSTERLSGPQLELCEYGIRFRQTSNLAMPNREQIRFLLAVIRENSLRTT